MAKKMQDFWLYSCACGLVGDSFDTTEENLTHISPLPAFPTKHKATVWPLRCDLSLIEFCKKNHSETDVSFCDG